MSKELHLKSFQNDYLGVGVFISIFRFVIPLFLHVWWSLLTHKRQLCAVIAVIVWVILPYYSPQDSRYSDLKFLQKCSCLDWIGGILCLGCIISLLLALQWGGAARPWNSPSIIALFCVFGVLLLIFTAWEWKERDKAMLPLRVFGRRTQLGCSLASVSVFLNMAMCWHSLVFHRHMHVGWKC